MREFIQNSAFLGVVISLLAYWLGTFLKRKFKLAIFNPLLIAVLLTMGVLCILKIDYSVYESGTKYISYLLTPATVSLAIPLYEQIEVLKKNIKAIIAGVTSGVLASLGTILALAVVFQVSHESYVTMLPKSITTAIGMGVSDELGGYVSITVALIVITGILGNVIAEPVLKLFRITEPVAKGIGLGSASHAIGTAKAMELGEVEGAMSSLSIVIAGILTVVGASIFAQFY